MGSGEAGPHVLAADCHRRPPDGSGPTRRCRPAALVSAGVERRLRLVWRADLFIIGYRGVTAIVLPKLGPGRLVSVLSVPRWAVNSGRPGSAVSRQTWPPGVCRWRYG